jgi:hypothetical protein
VTETKKPSLWRELIVRTIPAAVIEVLRVVLRHLPS